MTARFLSRNSLLKILQKIHLILVKKLLVACFCFIGCLDVLTSCNSLKMLIRVSEWVSYFLSTYQNWNVHTFFWVFHHKGSEALFADLGHFNRSSIKVNIHIAFSALFYFFFIHSLFHIVVQPDRLFAYNISISCSDVRGANCVPYQESKWSWRWILQVYTYSDVLANLYHSHASCCCCKPVTDISHLLGHQAISCTGLFSSC